MPPAFDAASRALAILVTTPGGPPKLEQSVLNTETPGATRSQGSCYTIRGAF